jgi:hypothetical protein
LVVKKGGPDFDAEINIANITPFTIQKGALPGDDPPSRLDGAFNSMKVDTNTDRRIPLKLKSFVDAKTLDDDAIKNPNRILKRAIDKLDIAETITFDVATGPSKTNTLNGGGTANISFLQGKQFAAQGGAPPQATPNADAVFMKSRFWIEVVMYDVEIPALFTRDPKAHKVTPVLLRPNMPNSDAPTPQFAITPPPFKANEGRRGKQVIKVPGIQVQYSQTVNLDFFGLTWPHMSVATLVPKEPQPFVMSG